MKVKNTPEIWLNAMGIGAEPTTTNDTTAAMWRVYELCALEWGADDQWLSTESRFNCRYSIYQYETEAGAIVEIIDSHQPRMGALEIAEVRLSDPEFRLLDVHWPDANTNLDCVQEVWWHHWQRDRNHSERPNYKTWEWSVLEELRNVMNSQRLRDCGKSSIEATANPVNVWPALDGYCIHLEGTDVFYALKHTEVLGDAFNPKRILNQMTAMEEIRVGFRPSIFRNSALNRRQA